MSKMGEIKYADFQAFLFPQDELMSREEEMEISQDIKLDACLMTSTPPSIDRSVDVLFWHKWFLGILYGQKKTLSKYLFGIQNPPRDLSSIEDVKELRRWLIQFMSLAYKGAGVYGGGFDFPEMELTTKGKFLIDWMAEAGMVLDLSHSGHNTARDALSHIRRNAIPIKVVATHSGCFSIYDHWRNFPDDVLRGIAGLGGIIGIPTVTFLLDAKSNDIFPFLNHVDYLVELIGIDHVAIGSDGTYQTIEPKKWEGMTAMMKEKLDADGSFGVRHPDHPLTLNTPKKMEVLEKIIMESGIIKKEDISKLMGGNLMKFFDGLK